MKRFLSLFAMLMMVSMSWATDVTFDFDNDYATLFPKIKGLSSSSSHDGDFTETQTATVGNISVIVTPSNTSSANCLWNKTGRLQLHGGTLTVSAPTGVKITNIAFTVGQWNANTSVSSGKVTGTGSARTWTASQDVNEVVFTIKGSTKLKKMVVTFEGEPQTDGIEATKSAQTESVRYIDTMGHQSVKPFKGLNIVVTTLSDGSRQITKIIR